MSEPGFYTIILIVLIKIFWQPSVLMRIRIIV